MKVPLIIGIDPGTTAGFAALDLDMNLVAVWSKKEMGLDSLVRRVYELGVPVACGTDRKSVPGFIERFCSKTGARAIAPPSDLTADEKRALLSGLKAGNIHELDALASAIYAFRKLEGLIQKIKKQAEAGEIGSIARIVIGSDIPISRAKELIKTEPKAREEVKIGITKDYRRLYESMLERVKRLGDEKELLSIELKKSEIKKKKAAHTVTKLKRIAEEYKKQAKAPQLFERKALDFKSLKGRIAHLEKTVKEAEEGYSGLLSRLSSSVLVKIIDNLGKAELDRKRRLLNIKKNDIIFIRDPSVISLDAAEELKKLCDIIILEKPNKLLQKKFIILSMGECRMSAHKDYGIVPRSLFNELIKKKDILSMVIDEYRKEKEN